MDTTTRGTATPAAAEPKAFRRRPGSELHGGNASATTGKMSRGCQTRVAAAAATPAQNHRRSVSSHIATTAKRMPGVLASGPPSASFANTGNEANTTADAIPAGTERKSRAA